MYLHAPVIHGGCMQVPRGLPMIKLNEEKLREIKTDIWIKLQFARSNAPIPSAELEYNHGLTGAQVRDIIRELRQEGYLIGSISNREDAKGGYFCIRSIEELNQTLKHLRCRIESMQHTVNAMEHTAGKVFAHKAQMELTI